MVVNLVKYKYCVDRFEIIFYLIVSEVIYEVNLPNCKLEMMNSTEEEKSFNQIVFQPSARAPAQSYPACSHISRGSQRTSQPPLLSPYKTHQVLEILLNSQFVEKYNTLGLGLTGFI